MQKWSGTPGMLQGQVWFSTAPHTASCRSVLKVFHRWSDEDLSTKQQPGVCFRDAFISTVDGKLQQLKKDARHGCYVSVPAHLLYQPSMESRRRYAGILLSAFAGSNGLKVLLDQCALTVARARQPDILHMVVGPGQDGKTLVFVDHMRAVFGSGFGCAPSSMLQTEREFQQQGSNFIQCCYLVFDECRREQGLIEDLVKVFVGGGWLPLRRNHEAETKYAHWAFAGKAWCLNVGDIPYLPTSQEISHARRFRCTFMRSHFTSNVADVDPDRKVFKADPSAKVFMASGEAVWCFYHDFLFPHLRKFGIHACSNALEYGTGSASTAKDSEWLLKRMNRSTDACCPEDLECQGTFDQKEKQRSTSEKIVRETHNVVDQDFFSAVGHRAVLLVSLGPRDVRFHGYVAR